MTPAEIATAHLRDVTCTFSCRRMLFILGMVPRNYRPQPPPHPELVAAAKALSESLAQPVDVIDGELVVELEEPVEAIVAARDHDLYLQRCIASGPALELLREPGAPAQKMWAWLCSRLAIPDVDYPDGVVKLGIGRSELPRVTEQAPERPGVLLWLVQPGRDRAIFLESPTTIGRDRHDIEIGLVIDDVALSRRHCALTRREGRWMIEDLGSSSGTYVESDMIDKRRLIPGMLIRVGSSLLVVLAVRS